MRVSGHDSDSDSAELLRLGLLDNTFIDADVDIASSFASVTADDSKHNVRLDTSADSDLLAIHTHEALHRSSTKQPRQRPKTTQRTLTRATPAADFATTALELRRKRNRDSMRRARDRQRTEQEKLARVIEKLEEQLERLMRAKESSVRSTGAAAYSQLLRETEALRDEHDRLSEHVRKHAHFQSRIGRLTALEQHEQVSAQQHADNADDCALLAPLLTWVTPAVVTSLVHYARDQLLAVADVTHSLVPTSQSILGWHAKRTLHANWGHYTMRKSFPHERPVWLADRTWACTVNCDVEEMQQVLPWTRGTTVLHRLSPDAVVIARDMNIPNLEDCDHPIRVRYILLVFRTPLSDTSGYLVGTVTLNVDGSTVDECLAQRVSHQHGMHALTMYAFIFTPMSDGDGCDVTLAGRSGDGSLTFAQKVLFEVLPSILRWENTFVAPILRVAG